MWIIKKKKYNLLGGGNKKAAHCFSSSFLKYVTEGIFAGLKTSGLSIWVKDKKRLDKMQISLQGTAARVKAPKPDQHSRQISRLESPPDRACRAPCELWRWDGTSRRQVHTAHQGFIVAGGWWGGWMEAVSKGIKRIYVPPPRWSVMFIRTNLNIYLHVSAWTGDHNPPTPLIQYELSFTLCYICSHLTDISQSKFVRHSWAALELPCPMPYWIKGRNKRLLKGSKQGDLLKGDFHYQQHRTGQPGFIHSPQLIGGTGPQPNTWNGPYFIHEVFVSSLMHYQPTREQIRHIVEL